MILDGYFNEDCLKLRSTYPKGKIVDSRPVYCNPSYVPGKRSRNHPLKRDIVLKCLSEEYKALWSCEEEVEDGH